jgi:hypothetical protein
VGGYAAEDDAVVLNPYSSLSAPEREAVVRNETARILMRSGRVPPPLFSLTPEQSGRFGEYGPVEAQRSTVAARLVSGDPSAGRGTPEQLSYAEQLRGHLGPQPQSAPPSPDPFGQSGFVAPSFPSGGDAGELDVPAGGAVPSLEERRSLRLLRAKVLSGELPEREARRSLGGVSPFASSAPGESELSDAALRRQFLKTQARARWIQSVIQAVPAEMTGIPGSIRGVSAFGRFRPLGYLAALSDPEGFQAAQLGTLSKGDLYDIAALPLSFLDVGLTTALAGAGLTRGGRYAAGLAEQARGLGGVGDLAADAAGGGARSALGPRAAVRRAYEGGRPRAVKEEFLVSRSWEGAPGEQRHLTRQEVGFVDPSRLRGFRGSLGEEQAFGQSSPGGKYDPQGWSELVNDIRGRGVQTPVVVKLLPGESSPVIVEGNHRVRAAIEAGVGRIPVDIRYHGHAERGGEWLLSKDVPTSPGPEPTDVEGLTRHTWKTVKGGLAHEGHGLWGAYEVGPSPGRPRAAVPEAPRRGSVEAQDADLVRLIDYIEDFVQKKRATDPDAGIETYFRAGGDTDRGVARYADKHLEELADGLPPGTSEEFQSGSVIDRESGARHYLRDEVHGGHIGQMRRYREEVRAGVHEGEIAVPEAPVPAAPAPPPTVLPAAAPTPADKLLAQLESIGTGRRPRRPGDPVPQRPTPEVAPTAQRTPSGAYPWTPEKARRNTIFNELAGLQRGKPETLMGAIQESRISQLYGHVAEHTGDIINRMAKELEFQDIPYGQKKIQNMLRTLEPGFMREVREQIASNLAYNKARGRKVPSVEAAEAELRVLGEEYAKAHRELPVYNEAQKLANDAAIAVGEFRFDDARAALRELNRYAKDDALWRSRATAIEPEFFNKAGSRRSSGFTPEDVPERLRPAAPTARGEARSAYDRARRGETAPELPPAPTQTPAFRIPADATPRLRQVADSGRYDVVDKGQDGVRHRFEYSVKGTEGFDEIPASITKDPDTGQQRSRPTAAKFDPEMATLEAVTDKWGTRYKVDLKPGWNADIPTDEAFIYRGMSQEEWLKAEETGVIKSSGEYNLGPEQEGLTYFSTDAGSATYYASSFAPPQFKATPDKHAVVVAIKKRPGVHVKGTGEHEVGLAGSIPLDEVVGRWEGRPYMSDTGFTEIIRDAHGTRDGSGYTPSIQLGWRRVEGGSAKRPRSAPPAPTQTPAFRRWFGESKVVDEKGEPMVVYHGTASEFEAFEAQPGHGSQAFHFTPTRGVAQSYSESSAKGRTRKAWTGDPTVIEAYLRLENPVFTSSDEFVINGKSYSASSLRADDIAELKALGHDGVVLHRSTDLADDWPMRPGQGPKSRGGDGTGVKEIAVFKPTQIKSATGNVGTYGPTDPRFAHGIVGAAGAGEAEAQRRQQP